MVNMQVNALAKTHSENTYALIQIANQPTLVKLAAAAFSYGEKRRKKE